MDLVTALARFVNAKVRKRGLHYFRGRRVKLTACGPESAQAEVTGSSVYRVHLTRDGKALHGSCSCPYSGRGEPCKHLWAAILAVDTKAGLRGLDGTVPATFTSESTGDAREAGPPRKVNAPRAPAWRAVLDQLGSAAPPVPAPTSSLLYVINAPATLESQQLSLQVLSGRKKRDGSWGKLYMLTLDRSDVPHLPDAADRKILSLLSGAAMGGSWGRWYSSPLVPTSCFLPAEMAAELLPQVCATGRCCLRLDAESDELEPAAWSDPPWELRLEVAETDRGDCILGGSIRRGEELLPPGTSALLLPGGFLHAAGQLSHLLPKDAHRWLALLRNPLPVPAAEREELLSRLLAAPGLPRLDLPESMRVEEVRSEPRPKVRLLAPDKRRHNDWPRAEVSFLYDGREVAAGAPDRGVYEPGERRFFLRDLEAERQHADRLPELGFRFAVHPPGEPPPMQIPTTRIPKAVRSLLAEGWSVEAEGKLYRSPGQFRLSVSSGVDWFELHGGAEFGGETVHLPALLAALRRGDGFVPLSDGSLGMLPEEWLKKLGPLARLGEPEGSHLRFQPPQAALLDVWLAEEPGTSCDEAFERARERLRGFAGIAPAPAPSSFRGELRGYQRAGLGWLHFLRDFGFGGCLADDMGLGKTVQVLALLEDRRRLRAQEGLPPSLVVVPRSLVFNWLAEAAHFTPELRVLDHTGAGRTREGDPFAGCDLVITTYGTLRRDVGTLRQMEFDYVILDEAQAIKNGDSQTAKAARLLRGRHRLALSGTPIENHLGELFSLLEFLNPGLLGSSPLLGGPSDELRNPDAGARSLLARALRPFILRRTKEQVAPELPAKTEQTLFCELPPKQRRLYDELRDHYRASLGARITEQGLGRTKILVLEALLRLRQAACHPGLLDRDRAAEPSAKLDLLLPQLQEILAEGHKALVFSQFTSFLGLLKQRLDREGHRYLYLDGRTRDRREKVEAFQTDPDCRLFLISLKAGGTGLNLTAADYVFLLDPWWNPAVESQAIDRAHRIGQSRPVFACRLVARDTVEEKILELQKSKRDLADAVIQADESLLASLSREYLELLLS